ncbi:hypothetical protein LJC20_01170 [Eubacteriales bacterium OttesenSCG-928-M02]|nr:hypothetical protein [Eubacteriales bacterium OttesenSCG-928-M02]
MWKRIKEWNWPHISFWFVFISLVGAIGYIVVVMIIEPWLRGPSVPHQRMGSDYVLMLIQCIFGVIILMLPSILERRFNMKIPAFMFILFTVFLYCAIFLGEVRRFYENVPHWDTILHIFSGAMLGSMGFCIISILNQSETVPMVLSPLFVAVFAFCFAQALGVIWEIYEYIVDGLMNTNMQWYQMADGTQLLGRAALADTMKDLIVDTLGAGVVSVIGYIALKSQHGLILKIQLKWNKKGKKIDANK